jgi:hypothetical protein
VSGASSPSPLHKDGCIPQAFPCHRGTACRSSGAYRGTRNLRAVQMLLGHAVLPALDDGTALSTIARKVGVGYATVARIAENAKEPSQEEERK